MSALLKRPSLTGALLGSADSSTSDWVAVAALVSGAAVWIAASHFLADGHPNAIFVQRAAALTHEHLARRGVDASPR